MSLFLFSKKERETLPILVMFAILESHNILLRMWLFTNLKGDFYGNRTSADPFS